MNLQDGEIRIVDDIVGANIENAICEILINKQFPWTFVGDVTSEIKKDKDGEKTPGFRHEFFNCSEKVKSPWFFLVFPILARALDAVGIDHVPSKLLQARCFLQNPLENGLEYDTIHIDDGFARRLVSVLYYVNDADGDTFFFEQTADDFPDPREVLSMSREYQQQQFDVKMRVSPKKGRCVIFDGRRYHASSSPKIKQGMPNNQRCIVNFSYFI